MNYSGLSGTANVAVTIVINTLKKNLILIIKGMLQLLLYVYCHLTEPCAHKFHYKALKKF